MKIITTLLTGCMILLSTAAWSGYVDINKANAETLAMELKGIGPKKAQAIVEYRKLNGAYKSIEDLGNVKGISDQTIANNKESLILKK